MNTRKIIKKLVKEGKIKPISASKGVSKSYQEKSKTSLKASKILFKQNLFEESISMSYYSMYHYSLSLLYLIGIKSENHFFTIHSLKEIFAIDNEKIKFAKKERINKQYYVDFKLTKKDAKELIELAEEFLEEISYFIESLKEADVSKYQRKAKELLK